MMPEETESSYPTNCAFSSSGRDLVKSSRKTMDVVGHVQLSDQGRGNRSCSVFTSATWMFPLIRTLVLRRCLRLFFYEFGARSSIVGFRAHLAEGARHFSCSIESSSCFQRSYLCKVW
jgi:hypothetical protein